MSKLHPMERLHQYGRPDSDFYPSDIGFEMWSKTYAQIALMVASELEPLALKIVQSSSYTMTYEALAAEALSTDVRRHLRDEIVTHDGKRLPPVDIDDPDAWAMFAERLERGRDRLVRFVGAALRGGQAVGGLAGVSWRSRVDELDKTDAEAAVADRKKRSDEKLRLKAEEDKALATAAKTRAERARGKDGS